MIDGVLDSSILESDGLEEFQALEVDENFHDFSPTYPALIDLLSDNSMAVVVFPGQENTTLDAGIISDEFFAAKTFPMKSKKVEFYIIPTCMVKICCDRGKWRRVLVIR